MPSTAVQSIEHCVKRIFGDDNSELVDRMKGGTLLRWVKPVEFWVKTVVDLPVFPLPNPYFLNFFPDVGQNASLSVSIFDCLFNYRQWGGGFSAIVEAAWTRSF